jgi:hypothetical protein
MGVCLAAQFEKGVQAAARDSNGESMRNSVTVEKPDDVAFVQRLVDQVSTRVCVGGEASCVYVGLCGPYRLMLVCCWAVQR